MYDIENNFKSHRIDEHQAQLMGNIRDYAKKLAYQIDCAPVSREKSLALTKLEEAVMWANSAIARNP